MIDLLPAVIYGFAGAVTPGPLLMFLFSQSLASGWKRTLPATFSPLITDGPVALLVLTVLSHVSTGLLYGLRLIGGAFILYLALEAAKAWRDFDQKNPASRHSFSNNLLKAMIINWLNPNVYLGWSLILGPMVLTAWKQAPDRGLALILAFYASLILTMIILVRIFGAARLLGIKTQRTLIACSSVALAVLAFYQIWIGASALLFKS